MHDQRPFAGEEKLSSPDEEAFFSCDYMDEGVSERSVTVGGFASRKKGAGYSLSLPPRPELV